MSSINEDVFGQTRFSQGRDAYADTGRALRDTIGLALEVSGTKLSREARVLLAAISFTASWSKIADRVYVGQLAELANINGDVDERHARRALKHWHDLGVFWWEPSARGCGNGHGRPSTLSLRAPDTQRPLLNVVEQRGPHVDEKPGHIWTPNPATSGRPTEKVLREARTEKTGANAPVRDVSSREGKSGDDRREELKSVFDEEIGQPVTRSEHGRRGKAVNELLEVGATGDELRARVLRFRSMWPGATVTDLAICKHWAQLGSAVGHLAREVRKREERAVSRIVEAPTKIGTCFVCEAETEVKLLGGQWFCERHGL